LNPPDPRMVVPYSSGKFLVREEIPFYICARPSGLFPCFYCKRVKPTRSLRSTEMKLGCGMKLVAG
jgi:hypothetical protein